GFDLAPPPHLVDGEPIDLPFPMESIRSDSPESVLQQVIAWGPIDEPSLCAPPGRQLAAMYANANAPEVLDLTEVRIVRLGDPVRSFAPRRLERFGRLSKAVPSPDGRFLAVLPEGAGASPSVLDMATGKPLDVPLAPFPNGYCPRVFSNNGRF